MIYKIDEEKIKKILVDKKIQSLKMECYPMVEYKNRIGKIKTVDYYQSNNICVLILYYDNLKKIKKDMTVPCERMKFYFAHCFYILTFYFTIFFRPNH